MVRSAEPICYLKNEHLKAPPSYYPPPSYPLPTPPLSYPRPLILRPPAYFETLTNRYSRNEQLQKEEASFRQAREQLLEDLERRVKAAKALLVAATAALKKEQRLSQVLLLIRRLLRFGRGLELHLRQITI